ncbi:TIGR03862 family flavoprotein [Microvirga rosea]|uniref:TIGR03862 family flavoprotein n=1 Tax=Microvirga rosea TaxID=2715425 RepID=UPI001D0B8D91|nr:TIGR03862 family flavoprotein [Microvirga rosea]MCB8819582.1 TIGR03862 family flavoprotein [Microvirga rosea]
MPSASAHRIPPHPSAPRVAVIGGGPAGLIAAETLGRAGIAVTVYDHMPSVGRKLLMAGRGGLNLTHSEDFAPFIGRYAAAEPPLRPLIEAFSPQDLRAWSQDLGQDTFVGSSGRVFPKAFKASPLLRAWLRRLEGLGVRFALRHRWTGWDADGLLRFSGPGGASITDSPDATLLALGGASWPRLGSDGGWVSLLAGRGVEVNPLRPSNMGFLVGWSDTIRSRFEGEPLKRIALSFETFHVRGEAIVTANGIEGGALYALSAPLREAIARDGRAVLRIDLRPDLTVESLVNRLKSPRKSQSLSTFLRKAAGLSPLGIALLREGPAALPTDPDGLASLVKSVPLTLTGTQPLDRAISTAGGVAFSQVDEHLMLRGLPGVFLAGEMLDWEAPTGGYLLQATFATGIGAARGILRYLRIPDAALTESRPSATPHP